MLPLRLTPFQALLQDPAHAQDTALLQGPA